VATSGQGAQIIRTGATIRTFGPGPIRTDRRIRRRDRPGLERRWVAQSAQAQCPQIWPTDCPHTPGRGGAGRCGRDGAVQCGCLNDESVVFSPCSVFVCELRRTSIGRLACGCWAWCRPSCASARCRSSTPSRRGRPTAEARRGRGTSEGGHRRGQGAPARDHRQRQASVGPQGLPRHHHGRRGQRDAHLPPAR
jgi:hypothetical protein